MRLYVFSSGALTLAKRILQNGAPGNTTVPVGFFVIKHPKGNVLFDTGNNDKIINDPGYWGPFIQGLGPVRTPDVAIDTQLQKIGMKPDDIQYVVYSHFHADHAGNVGKFPKSTHVAQLSEIRSAFWPAMGYATFYITKDFEMLRAGTGQPLPAGWKVMQLEGDLDLFRDGSVFIKRTVSHTPGSQMLVVRLPKTGTVVLTGDAVYLQENLDKNLLPDVGSAYEPSGMLEAYEWVREVRDREKATVIFSHDPDVFKASKHAPEYYE
jgi:glyoxylase-like metal-dependent hydrolase (beta-lactamase superfamily II)